jgi:hypothetical protein
LQIYLLHLEASESFSKFLAEDDPARIAKGD